MELTANDKFPFLGNFTALCDFIKHHGVDEIIVIVSEGLRVDVETLANYPMGGYSRATNNDGSFYKKNGCYYFVLQDVKQNLEEYEWFYSRLRDDISREVFLYQLRFRIVPVRDYLQAAYSLSSQYPQYFDEDIIRLGRDEVFVDCGGFIGDTSKEFIGRCGDYKRIYVYEPLVENAAKCREALANDRDVIIRQVGVGARSSKRAFTGGGSSGSFAEGAMHTSSESDALDIISLDEDITEPVTFIKMDVECFEPESIRGAVGHIKNDSPKLAICLYHMVSDFWEIPKQINEINPDYSYYLRHYEPMQNWEYVLYAIPGRQSAAAIDNTKYIADVTQRISDFLAESAPLIEQVNELPFDVAAELYEMLDFAANTVTQHIKAIDPEMRVTICDRLDRLLERIVDLEPVFDLPGHSIYTPAVHDYRRWNNVELMKDKGLVGYTLAKEVGGHPVMFFGTEEPDYPYLQQLPELEFLFDNADIGKSDPYFDHLNAFHSKMDTLILHGMYTQTIGYLERYRGLRPEGKVYCGLDMNGFWMDALDWNHAQAKKFAENCDVVATSCRSLRDALNRNPNVHFPCRWYPNAFLTAPNTQIVADSDKKENVILTVGRIGTAQKNTADLLLAFAKASDALQTWTLRLVGSIEPEFEEQIGDFFEIRPDLKDRVIFTGPIRDKDELYAEYAKAKIFVLTSWFEGGTPNVYAEALFHGCMFVTSNIDAADDITNFGELGKKYGMGDANALASTLAYVAARANRQGMIDHIPKALAYAKKYYDWNRNAKKLAYMLYRDMSSNI